MPSKPCGAGRSGSVTKGRATPGPDDFILPPSQASPGARHLPWGNLSRHRFEIWRRRLGVWRSCSDLPGPRSRLQGCRFILSRDRPRSGDAESESGGFVSISRDPGADFQDIAPISPDVDRRSGDAEPESGDIAPISRDDGADSRDFAPTSPGADRRSGDAEPASGDLAPFSRDDGADSRDFAPTSPGVGSRSGDARQSLEI